jgi:hypothetical protein
MCLILVAIVSQSIPREPLHSVTLPQPSQEAQWALVASCQPKCWSYGPRSALCNLSRWSSSTMDWHNKQCMSWILSASCLDEWFLLWMLCMTTVTLDSNLQLSTYTCESFFSKMKLTKHKTRSNIADANLQHQLRCANTQIEIDLQKLSERVEKQISH